jgi:hypothetical protein
MPLEDGASRGATAYLKVEKPRFLFLEGSTGAVAAADVATVALLEASAAHAGASAARTGTSAVCAASSVDRPAAGAPQAVALLPPPRLSVKGVQAPTSQGEPAPRRSPPLHLSTTNPPMLPRGKPLLLEQPEFFVPLFPVLLPPDPPLLFTRRPLLFPPLRRARALGLGAWAGQTARRP